MHIHLIPNKSHPVMALPTQYVGPLTVFTSMHWSEARGCYLGVAEVGATDRAHAPERDSVDLPPNTEGMATFAMLRYSQHLADVLGGPGDSDDSTGGLPVWVGK